MFRFGNAAFGKYQIRTSLSKNNLDFSMTPESQLADLTRHQNILVEKPFILDSVTVKSQILLSENVRISFNLPEDSVNSTPDVSHFFIFLETRPRFYVQHVFIFENFRVHFNTFKTGTLTPRIWAKVSFPNL